eukprot:GHVN01095423.1.p1 GENE.GHVN01095423.1~~GHVN01095423.1.p1  ORF type:complete len:100 (-),score=15.32 GHVN01095423.1:1134-1433(-)
MTPMLTTAFESIVYGLETNSIGGKRGKTVYFELNLLNYELNEIISPLTQSHSSIDLARICVYGINSLSEALQTNNSITSIGLSTTVAVVKVVRARDINQ